MEFIALGPCYEGCPCGYFPVCDGSGPGPGNYCYCELLS